MYTKYWEVVHHTSAVRGRDYAELRVHCKVDGHKIAACAIISNQTLWWLSETQQVEGITIFRKDLDRIMKSNICFLNKKLDGAIGDYHKQLFEEFRAAKDDYYGGTLAKPKIEQWTRSLFP